MYVCVCVCVCVYVCMYVCMSVCLYVCMSVCMSVCLYTEILYGSLITVGLVPATSSTTAAAAAADNDDDGQTVLRRHPGFTADSVGYNAETGQLVHLLSLCHCLML